MITLIPNLKEPLFLRVEIERAKNRVNIIIYTAKPGMVIGRGGSEKDATVAVYLKLLIRKSLFVSLKLKSQKLMLN